MSFSVVPEQLHNAKKQNSCDYLTMTTRLYDMFQTMTRIAPKLPIIKPLPHLTQVVKTRKKSPEIVKKVLSHWMQVYFS